MRKLRNVLCFCLCLTLVFSTANLVQAKKAKKPKLNKTSASVYVGKTVKLKVKNGKGKIKWSSSKKSVATVSSKGVVKALKKGKATITAKVKKVKLKCKITVKEKVSYVSQMVENFESYEPGTDWANFTLGEGLTSGGNEGAHYQKPGETMKVVTDPENPSNKVLEVKPMFYSFCPVFTVDLAKLTGIPTKKLGDYYGIRAKIRVISDASSHVGVGFGAFFGKAGTINKKYAFNTYTSSETLKGKYASEKEFYKFYYAKGMITGLKAEDDQMPAHSTDGSKVKGYSEDGKGKVGFSTKTTKFTKYLTSSLRGLTSFDFVLGGSYKGPTGKEKLTWYMDDVELISKK